jgi:hypothetical protein
MTTLVRIAERAGANLFHLEEVVARNSLACNGSRCSKAAGGTI